MLFLFITWIFIESNLEDIFVINFKSALSILILFFENKLIYEAV